MDLEWRPLYPGLGSILLLVYGTDELARVAQRVNGQGWLSEVARHQRDHRRRPQVVAPTRAAAMRWAERWTRANLERIRSQLPRAVLAFGCAKMVWPASNPEHDLRAATSPTPAAPSSDGARTLPARS
jgi:hypothetical protein